MSFPHDRSVDDQPELSGVTDTLTILRHGLPAPRAGEPSAATSARDTPFPAVGHPQLRRARGRRRRVRGRVIWWIVVAVVGALTLVVCSGMALGIMSVTNTGTGLDQAPDGDQPAPSADAMPGLDGVYPGGAARSVPVTVRNEADAPFEITAVRPDLSGLPARCPAAIWRIAVSGALPTVGAGGRSTVSLPVSLAANAPNECQSITVTVPVIIEGLQHRDAASAATAPVEEASAPAGSIAEPSPVAGSTPATIRSAAVVTTATLGGPVASVDVRGSQVAVTVGRPASGPAPDGYQVDIVAASGRRSLCTPATGGSCLDTSVPAAADRSYLASAHLGEHWVRDAPTMTAWTPPPAPQLSFTDGDQPSDSALTLDAAAAANGYDVSVFVDGAGSPFHSERVAAGARLSLIVEPPGYGPGRHRIVAVSSFHGRRASSRTLRLTVSSDADPTTPITVVPEPPEPSAPFVPPAAPAPPEAGAPSAGSAPPPKVQDPKVDQPAAAAVRQGP